MIISGLVFIFNSPPPPKDDSIPAFGIKGPISFEVFAKRGSKQFQVSPRAKLMQDDALRFVLKTSSPGFAAVFAIDGTRRVSSFYPDIQSDKKAPALAVQKAGRFEFPDSIVLDDIVGPETYFVVFSKKSFIPQDIYSLFNKSLKRQAIDKLKKSLKKQGFQVEELLVQKVKKRK